MRRLLLSLPVFVTACTSADPGDAAACTDADGLADGEVVAAIDAVAWASTATWLWQGDGAQINVATADGWRFTIVAQTAGGGTLKAAVDDGRFPISAVLEEGGDGWALAYPTDGASYTTDLGGGVLTLVGLESDVLGACFSFDAEDSGGGTLSVSDGALRALPFE